MDLCNPWIVMCKIAINILYATIYGHSINCSLSTLYKVRIKQTRFNFALVTASLCFEDMHIYHKVGKFGGREVWRIKFFQTFGERKFGKLIDQPIGY